MTSGSTNSLPDDLFESPEYFLSDIDLQHGQCLFVRMTRDTYRESSFLDQRLTPAELPPVVAPLQRVMDMMASRNVQQRPVRYVFHTAFCGSTLLSRCMDLPGVCLSYKEPLCFHKIGDAFRSLEGQRAPAAQLQMADHVLAMIVALLSRTYAPTELPLIKPSDSVNNLIPHVLRLHAESMALLLYFELEDFVVAMLKRDGRRQYLRSLLPRAEWMTSRCEALRGVQGESLSDAHAAAFVWLATIYECLDAQAKFGDRLSTLCGRDFLNDSAGVLPCVVRWFDGSLSDAQVRAFLECDALSEDSKRPGRSFDQAEYDAKLRSEREALSSEIEEAQRWAAERLSKRPVPLPMPFNLMRG